MSKELREEYKKLTENEIWFYYTNVNVDTHDEETYIDSDFVEWLEQQNTELKAESKKDFHKFEVLQDDYARLKAEVKRLHSVIIDLNIENHLLSAPEPPKAEQ